ncbi:MAG: tyrosine-type recombinase/integrase [Sulfurovum sp.]
MTTTKYEGLYYRKNKRGRKVFYARFKIAKKAYLRKLGEEPQMNTHQANLARAELIGSFKNGTIVSDKSMTKFFEEYVEYRRASLSESWYYNITKNYNKHLKLKIGEKTPESVTSLEIQKIINDMLDGKNENGRKYKPSTVKQIKDCISGLYMYIIKHGVAVINIGRDLQIPAFDNKIYFTISDVKAQVLFDTILGYRAISWRAYFIWLLHGRRKMEVAQMRWEWIDFDTMTYRVPSVVAKTTKDVIAPMTKLLQDALEKHGLKSMGYIFEGKGETGHITSTGADFHWRNIRAFAGLPSMRLHDIRHLIGFMGVNSGYSLEMIGSVLGHSSTATTKRYSNVKSDSAREVLGNMFDRFIK